MRFKFRRQVVIQIVGWLLIVLVISGVGAFIILGDQQQKLYAAVRKTMPQFCPDRLQVYFTFIGCGQAGIYTMFQYDARTCQIQATNLMYSATDLMSTTGKVQELPISVTPCAY